MKKLVSLLAAAVLVASAGSAGAQIIEGEHLIIQWGEADPFPSNGHEVGRIFVPAHEGETSYVEHWVLFEDYVYPSRDGESVTTEIVRATEQHVSEEAFFADSAKQVNDGGRYVLVEATEFDKVPAVDEKGVVGCDFSAVGFGGRGFGVCALALALVAYRRRKTR